MSSAFVIKEWQGRGTAAKGGVGGLEKDVHGKREDRRMAENRPHGQVPGRAEGQGPETPFFWRRGGGGGGLGRGEQLRSGGMQLSPRSKECIDVPCKQTVCLERCPSAQGCRGSLGPFPVCLMCVAFLAGCTDTFTLDMEDVGDIQAIDVVQHRHPGAGGAQKWLLESVEVHNLSTGQFKRTVCGRPAVGNIFIGFSAQCVAGP